MLATGVTARAVTLPGADRSNVHPYADVITGAVTLGESVAVIGAGGIGFDVSEFLTHTGGTEPQSREDWMREWGVGDPDVARGRLVAASPETSPRQVDLRQRKTSKVGAGLGKTSGWVHRSTLNHRGVEMIRGVVYDRIDDAGLHLTLGSGKSARLRLLEVDDVVVCAGQEPWRDLLADLQAARGERSRHRWRRRRRRGRRQAGDRSGHPGRRCVLSGWPESSLLINMWTERCTTGPNGG